MNSDTKENLTKQSTWKRIAYMVMFYGPVRELSVLSDQLESAATTAERVFEILDTEPDVTDQADAVDPGLVKGQIAFHNVSFTYDGFERILDRVNFHVEPGEMIGLRCRKIDPRESDFQIL